MRDPRDSTRPSVQYTAALSFDKAAVDQLEVAGVVADRPVEYVGVIAVFGEAAAVEHIETRCVGTG